MTVSAVHIKTEGFKCPACPSIIRKALKGLPGIIDVVAVESMHVTSVLYDADAVTPPQICERIEKCGFDTEEPTKH